MELFHRQYGEKNRPKIIILHGLFGSSDNWVSIAKVLSQDYCIYLLDQRNHGQSPHSQTWTYEAMSEDLLKFVESQYIEPPIVLGHSMGGKTAMFFASMFPEKLSRLIIVDIAPRAYPVHHKDILEGLHALDLSQISTRKEADTRLANYIEEVGIRQFLLKNLYRKEDNSFGWRLNLELISEKIEQVGQALPSDARVEVPTLFVKGANSRYIQDKDMVKIEQHFSNFELQTIENAGHWVHAEQTQAFLEVIKKNLENV